MARSTGTHPNTHKTDQARAQVAMMIVVLLPLCGGRVWGLCGLCVCVC